MLDVVTQNLGLAYSGAGRHDRAIELLDESVELARGSGDAAHVASALRSLGRALLLGEREPERALALLREGLALSIELDERPGILETLETLASGRRPAHGRGADRRRRGGARGGRGGAAARRGGVGRRGQGSRLREALGGDAYAAAVRAGGVVDLTDALERAVSEQQIRVSPD